MATGLRVRGQAQGLTLPEVEGGMEGVARKGEGQAQGPDPTGIAEGKSMTTGQRVRGQAQGLTLPEVEGGMEGVARMGGGQAQGLDPTGSR